MSNYVYRDLSGLLIKKIKLSHFYPPTRMYIAFFYVSSLKIVKPEVLIVIFHLPSFGLDKKILFKTLKIQNKYHNMELYTSQC